MRHFWTITAVAICLTLQPAFGQNSPPAPAGEVVGSGNFSPIVTNFDQSIEFYRDVLGLQRRVRDVQGKPSARDCARSEQSIS